MKPKMSWLPVGLLLALSLFLMACTSGVAGSGVPASDTRAVSGFDEVESHGVIELRVTVGPKHSCVLSGDDNLLPLIETKVDGDRLILRSDKKLSPDEPLVATIIMPDVEALRVSGVSKANVEGFDNDALEVRVSGAGEVTAKGKTKRLTLKLSGATNIDAKSVDADRVEVDASGAANVDVGEPKQLDVDISGAGEVRYSGSPEIKQSISGAGEVKQR